MNPDPPWLEDLHLMKEGIKMKLAPIFEDSKEFRYDDLYLLTVGTEAGHEILTTCLDIAHMLIKKNISYGLCVTVDTSTIFLFEKCPSIISTCSY